MFYTRRGMWGWEHQVGLKTPGAPPLFPSLPGLLLLPARRLGTAFAASFEKKGSGLSGLVSGSKEWNGKCQPAGSQAGLCQAYNLNKGHDRARFKCTNPNKCNKALE